MQGRRSCLLVFLCTAFELVPFLSPGFCLCCQALEKVPTGIHERAPVFLGSYDDVETIKQLYAKLT